MNDNRFYIYAWFYKDTGQCFYVGKGTQDRYKDINDRSIIFKEIIKMHPVAVRILANNLTEEMAIELEKKTIEALTLFRYPLINYKFGEPSPAQAEGIKEAKKVGKYKGRKPIEVDNLKFKTLYEQWKAGRITAVDMQKQLNLTAPTFYRRVKTYEEVQ